MSIKPYFILGSALVASFAFAQASLGTVGDTQGGLVTSAGGTSVSLIVFGAPIHDGERFVTSSSGPTTLRLNNGCHLTLQPNQALTIDSRSTCNQLIAAVTSVGGASVAGGGGSFGMRLVAVTGLAAGTWLIHDRVLSKNESLSGH